jgi:hypothetical protein
MRDKCDIVKIILKKDKNNKVIGMERKLDTGQDASNP